MSINFGTVLGVGIAAGGSALISYVCDCDSGEYRTSAYSDAPPAYNSAISRRTKYLTIITGLIGVLGGGGYAATQYYCGCKH